MGGGATGATWENVEEHRRSTAWKNSDVEKVTSTERDTALELWVGNSARLTGRIIEGKS